MNCRRIQELIPLHIEGDLKTGQDGSVLSHLEQCAECARVASEYRASQEWLKSYAPPDLEEEFFDGLRADVLREIEASTPRQSLLYRFGLHRFGPRFALNPASFALASAVAVGLFFGLALYAYSNMGRGLSNDEIPLYLRGEGGSAQVPELDTRAPSDIAWKIPSRSQVVKARGNGARRRAHVVAGTRPGVIESREPVATAAIGAESPRNVLRIELQTADPNIRIIWFAPSGTTTEDLRPMTSTEIEQEITHASD